MKVWIVGISDCESNSVVCICATKEIAKRELFKKRDRLVKEWREMDESTQKFIEKWSKEQGRSIHKEEMYKNMIKNLEGNDYENWNNFPQECPYICEQEILEK